MLPSGSRFPKTRFCHAPGNGHRNIVGGEKVCTKPDIMWICTSSLWSSSSDTPNVTPGLPVLFCQGKSPIFTIWGILSKPMEYIILLTHDHRLIPELSRSDTLNSPDLRDFDPLIETRRRSVGVQPAVVTESLSCKYLPDGSPAET